MDLDALEAKWRSDLGLVGSTGVTDGQQDVLALIDRLRAAERVCRDMECFDTSCDCSCSVHDANGDRCDECLGCVAHADLVAWQELGLPSADDVLGILTAN
jgi:hypothetical protein